MTNGVMHGDLGKIVKFRPAGGGSSDWKEKMEISGGTSTVVGILGQVGRNFRWGGGGGLEEDKIVRE